VEESVPRRGGAGAAGRLESGVENPFQVLGLPERFDLDGAAVQRGYLSRAAQVHPDVVGDEEEAAVRAAQLNRARAVLLNDERRANALLEVLGGPGKEQDKSLPDGFLMEMMETREAIEAAVEGGDEAERARWVGWAEEQRKAYTARVGELFRGGTGQERLRTVRRELNAWRYIERLIEQLSPRYDPNVSDLEGQ
jgi:molecular chaperone HscB